ALESVTHPSRFNFRGNLIDDVALFVLLLQLELHTAARVSAEDDVQSLGVHEREDGLPRSPFPLESFEVVFQGRFFLLLGHRYSSEETQQQAQDEARGRETSHGLSTSALRKANARFGAATLRCGELKTIHARCP